MQLHIQGKGSITLRQADFVASGGEGAVYARGDLAYKIYSDAAKMVPAAKIRELSALNRDTILRPLDILLDEHKVPVGYTMQRVKDPQTLCQAFTRAFRERRCLTPDRMLALVLNLREGVQHVHDCGMLIVDLNEMNFLLDSTLQEVLSIDVAGYQTPGFPATALMDSVRDRHSTGFSAGTDWFSFAVVSFQMLVGIHPYRGKHPTLPDLDSRMRSNISVLRPEVSIPAVCYPFSVVPSAYLDWYRAVLDGGMRVPPPDGPRQVAVLPASWDSDAVQVTASGSLSIRELCRFPSPVLDLLPAPGGYAAVIREGLYYRGRTWPAGPDARLALTPREGHVLAGWIEDGKVCLFDVTTGQALPAGLRGEALTSYDGRLYVKSGASLLELAWLELAAGVRVSARPVANALEHATRLFDGVAVQSMLGSCYGTLFPRPRAAYTVAVPELDAYRVVDARFDGDVLMLVGVRDGKYDRYVLRFEPGYRAYDARVLRDVDYCALNFVTLEHGVCLHLTESEELEAFSSMKDVPGRKLVAGSTSQAGRLFKDGTRALLAQGDTLYQISTRASGK